jgi:hypothetical protein
MDAAFHILRRGAVAPEALREFVQAAITPDETKSTILGNLSRVLERLKSAG